MLGHVRRFKEEREPDLYEMEERRGADLMYSVSMENDNANDFVNEFFDDDFYFLCEDTY